MFHTILPCPGFHVKPYLNPYESGLCASGTHVENGDSGSHGTESAADSERATLASRFGTFPSSTWTTSIGCVMRSSYRGVSACRHPEQSTYSGFKTVRFG